MRLSRSSSGSPSASTRCARRSPVSITSPHLSEAIILSTCLRTEVYAVVERFHDGVAEIEAFFASRMGAGGRSRASAGDSMGHAMTQASQGGEHLEAGEQGAPRPAAACSSSAAG